MKRKLSLRTLLSLVFGGLVLLTAVATLGIVGGASGEAAVDDAIERGRQSQRVLSERIGAEFAKVERAAELQALIAPPGSTTAADGAAIFSLVPIASASPAPAGVTEGWSWLGTAPVYRAPGAATLARIDLDQVRSIMEAFMPQGVAGVLLGEGRILARARSGGRVDEATNDELMALFAAEVDEDDRVEEAPGLRRVERDDDEPVFLSTETLPTPGIDLSIGFATTPSTVATTFGLILFASAIAAGIALVAVAAALFVAKRVATSVGGVRDALHDIAELNLDAVEPMAPMPARELEDIRHGLDRAVRSLKAFGMFVPKALVQRLLERGDGSLRLAEECEVSVLFTDIVGFTTIAAAMRPAEVTAMLDEHFALVSSAVEREGGTVDKYVGDGILAYWGAPEPQSDHAARAIRAAAAIQRAHTDAVAEGRAAFGLRIGLHSGPAVAGTVGTAARLDYTIVGDTVNVASRLEQLGREIDPDCPCCALVSGDTCRLAGSDGCDPLGSRALRGRDGTVEVHRLRDGA